MKTRSSASIVSYDLRPAKQCERRIMLDSFLTAMEAGFAVPKYRYVGMGGNRFYDFIMMHKYLGIDDMVSIEHDPKMFVRAVFNRPFHFISVSNLSVHDFVLEDHYTGNSIYWLDYDGEMGTSVATDIAALASRICIGDFVFVTVRGTPPKRLEKESSANRLIELNEEFEELAGSLSITDVENSSFYVAVKKLLSASFSKAFSKLATGVFHPFVRVRYSDSTEMVSIGGVFDGQSSDGQSRFERFLELMRVRMPFLYKDWPELYKLARFNYTDKERRLFDLAVTAQEGANEMEELRRLGFGSSEIRRYGELLRFHPRYVETYL